MTAAFGQGIGPAQFTATDAGIAGPWNSAILTGSPSVSADAKELARLGRALDAHEARWPEAVAAIRLLALTGCRRGEVLNLRWRDIGEDAINLADSKTGPRAVPLGEAARALIETLPDPGKLEAFLFPSFAHGKGY